MGKKDSTNSGANRLDHKIAEWCWMVVKRHFGPDHVFFVEGDSFLRLASRYLPLDNSEHVESENQSKVEFPCGHARCSQTFDSLIKYEAHYNLSHRNVCGTCYMIFPSAHLLDIHILETHDVLFKLLAQKSKMYQCYLEGCQEKFTDGKERHQHLIQQHCYPANYRYRHTDGMKSKKGKPNKTQPDIASGMCKTDTEGSKTGLVEGKSLSSSVGGNSQFGTVPGECTDMDIDPHCDFQHRKVKLKESKFKPRVPANICFGQGVGRGFQRDRVKPKKHWHNQKKGTKNTATDIENLDLKDISAALDMDI